jgi:hypothetical protein
MATLTVEIDKERDLPALQAVLERMGLEAGRVHSHEYVMAYMEEKLKRLRAKKNG